MYKRTTVDTYLDKKDINTRRRDGLLFKTERPRSELYKNSVKYKGANEWNALDPSTRNITLYSEFKLKHQCYLHNSIYE